MSHRNSVQLEIAGIPLKIVSEGYHWELPSAYWGFTTTNCESPPAQVLSICSGNSPSLLLGRRIFKAGGSWTLYMDKEGQLVFDIPYSSAGGYARRLAFFTPDFESAKVYVGLNNQRHPKDLAGLFPLEYPLYKLAMINLLAQGRGVMLHAAAVIEGGEAIVFAAPSGAGKSTLARLYSGKDGVTVLNDDAIVVRKVEGQYWAFGTPWCGPTSVCSPLGAPISRIYAIEHAAENFARPIKKLDAVATLFARAFIPFYRPAGIEFTLDFLAELGQSVPCYQLGFVPDASVISFVRQMGPG